MGCTRPTLRQIYNTVLLSLLVVSIVLLVWYRRSVRISEEIISVVEAASSVGLLNVTVGELPESAEAAYLSHLSRCYNLTEENYNDCNG